MSRKFRAHNPRRFAETLSTTASRSRRPLLFFSGREDPFLSLCHDGSYGEHEYRTNIIIESIIMIIESVLSPFPGQFPHYFKQHFLYFFPLPQGHGSPIGTIDVGSAKTSTERDRYERKISINSSAESVVA